MENPGKTPNHKEIQIKHGQQKQIIEIHVNSHQIPKHTKVNQYTKKVVYTNSSKITKHFELNTKNQTNVHIKNTWMDKFHKNTTV